MRILKYLIGLLFTAVVFCGLFFVCQYYGRSARAFYMETPGKTVTGSIDFSKTSVDQLVENYVNNMLERDIVITAVGDMKFYEWQLQRAYNPETETFSFVPAFEYISKYFESTNYVVGDIETTMAGANGSTDTRFYGYGADRSTMRFNTPEILAVNLADAGFDMITTANEHALDSGTSGVAATINRLENAGITHIGTRRSADAPAYVIEKVNGLKIGFIAYTNLLTDTEDETAVSVVNYLDNYNEEKIDQMCAQIQQMRAEGAEAVVVLLHFGAEYAVQPQDTDRGLAHRLINAGADVILGSHTHVPGLIETVDVPNEDGSSRRGLIVYSMGNFLTSQQHLDGSSQHRDMGMICEIVFKKLKDMVYIGGLNVIPVYSNWTKDSVVTLPILEAHDLPDNYNEIFDAYAVRRINTAYETIFPQLLESSGLSYVYEDYKYKISFENSNNVVDE